jgi:hypothetical protein
VVLCALGVAGVIGWQRLSVAELRQERAAAAELRLDALAAEAENRRLAGLLPADAELGRLRATAAEVAKREAEVFALRRDLARPEELTPGSDRFAVGATVPAGDWRNAGAATPAAALETVLWAAAGGDVAAFAGRLQLGKDSRAAAEALQATLPETMRVHGRTPEELVAFLALRDVPLGAATVRRWYDADAASQQVTVELAAPDGVTKETNLVFARANDGWKLSVTEPVVARYAAMLKAGAPGEGK